MFWAPKTELMAIAFVIWGLITALSVSALIIKLCIHIRRNRKRAMGFFHPYTNDGGGGERVLWCAVKAIQEETSHLDLDCVIYTGDHDASPHSLMARALDWFGVKLIHPPKVLSLSLSLSLCGISEISWLDLGFYLIVSLRICLDHVVSVEMFKMY